MVIPLPLIGLELQHFGQSVGTFSHYLFAGEISSKLF